jgi:hypothetical protein
VGAFSARSGIKSAELGLTVTRCGCGDPDQHRGSVCPRPRAVEQLGTVAYWHRNPLKRLLWRVGRFFKGVFHG